jgi:hypothetical protein
MFKRDEFRRFRLIFVIEKEFLAKTQISFGIYSDTMNVVDKTDFRITVGIFPGVVYEAEFVGCLHSINHVT